MGNSPKRKPQVSS